MQEAWFRRWGRIYLPASLMGWAISLLTIGIAVADFLAVDHHSHSGSDTLIGAVPVITVLFLLLFLLAARSSKPD